MKTTATSNFFSAVLVCALVVSANAADPKIEKKQLEIRNMAHDTLPEHEIEQPLSHRRRQWKSCMKSGSCAESVCCGHSISSSRSKVGSDQLILSLNAFGNYAQSGCCAL